MLVTAMPMNTIARVPSFVKTKEIQSPDRGLTRTSELESSAYAALRHITLVTRSIFGPLSHTRISKSEFKNEISSSALLDIQLTLFCVCGVDSFLPGLEHV